MQGAILDKTVQLVINWRKHVFVRAQDQRWYFEHLYFDDLLHAYLLLWSKKFFAHLSPCALKDKWLLQLKRYIHYFLFYAKFNKMYYYNYSIKNLILTFLILNHTPYIYIKERKLIHFIICKNFTPQAVLKMLIICSQIWKEIILKFMSFN